MTDFSMESSSQQPLRIQSVRAVDPPKWLFKDNGRLATFLPTLDVTQGQVHVLVPSGQGDVAWLWAKYWQVDKMLSEQGRQLVWHFPEDGVRRVEPYAKLVGMNIGDWLSIDIKELLDCPGEFIEEDFEKGFIGYLHANVHIEEGNPLHEGAPKYDPVTNNRTWHPWLDFQNPAPPVREVKGVPLPYSPDYVCRHTDKSQREPYFVVHAGSATFAEGNYMPKQWARMIGKLETRAPVRLVGLEWDRRMIDDIHKYYTPKLVPWINMPYPIVLSEIANSSGMVGIDSGLTIMATYYGLPAMRGYPHWLEKMPGTFEDPETLHHQNKAMFLDDIYDELGDWVNTLDLE